MKVLFPLPGGAIGGSHRSTIELHKQLLASGVNSELLLHKLDTPLSSLLRHENIPFKTMSGIKLAGESSNIINIVFRVAYNTITIRKYINKNHITIVHGNDLRINLTWSLPTKFSNAYFVWHQRQLLSDSLYWKAINYLSDYFISISKYVYNTIPSNIPENKKTYIYNPFEVNMPIISNQKIRNDKAKLGVPVDNFVIGYIGRLVERKNVDKLLKSFLSILKLNKKITLLIVGKGDINYTRELHTIIKSNNIEDSVCMVGFIKNIYSVYPLLDVMVAPASDEPFGRTLVESMLARVPVVAYKSGAHTEIINHNETGVLYSDNGLLKSIDVIINNKKFRDNLINKAYYFAKENFSSDNHRDKVLQIYRGLDR
jgi:glycosyltransferase involved in cell wall biosynthesis